MNDSKFKRSVKNGFAGLIAHLSTGLFYPLELIKIRMQVNENKKIYIKEIINEIVNKEGIRGLYRGFYFSLFVGSISNYLFFMK